MIFTLVLSYCLPNAIGDSFGDFVRINPNQKFDERWSRLPTDDEITIAVKDDLGRRTAYPECQSNYKATAGGVVKMHHPTYGNLAFYSVNIEYDRPTDWSGPRGQDCLFKEGGGSRWPDYVPKPGHHREIVYQSLTQMRLSTGYIWTFEHMGEWRDDFTPKSDACYGHTLDCIRNAGWLPGFAGESQSSQTTLQPTYQLDVHAYADLLGDQGCQISVSVWRGFETQNPQQVGNANLQIVITYEDTGRIRFQKSGIITSESGVYSIKWPWAAQDLGNTFAVEITATDPRSGASGRTRITIDAPGLSTDLRVVVNDDNHASFCDFIVTVTAAESNTPVAKANLVLRLFHMLTCGGSGCIGDNRLVKEWKAQTDSTGHYTYHNDWSGSGGDMWRFDVYASKEGFSGEKFTNTHVAERAVYFMIATTTMGSTTMDTVGGGDSSNTPTATATITASQSANLNTFEYAIAAVALAAMGALLLKSRTRLKQKDESVPPAAGR